MTLSMFTDLIDPKVSGIDADWIILEYGNIEDELAQFRMDNPELVDRVHYFQWIMQSKDYDDTAALVSVLDSVVAVPTTVIHLAGGLGIDAHCLLPVVPQWRFGYDPSWSDCPWHKSVKLYRTKIGESKEQVIANFIPDYNAYLQSFFGGEMKEAAQS